MDELRRALAQARATWPTVRIDDEEFRSFVAERAESQSLAHTDDLYLACACARGDAHALEAFDARYMPQIARAVGKLKLATSEVDEVLQQVRKLLFVEDGGPRRITRYRGTGPLVAWARTMAVRVAVDRMRGNRRRVTQEESMLDGLVDDIDPGSELELLRRTYSAEMRAALADELARLAPDDQLLLRLHYIDGLSTAKIGVMNGKHAVTVLRRLERVRAGLLKNIEKALRTRLDVSSTELESIVRLVASNFHLTLTRVLRNKRPAANRPKR